MDARALLCGEEQAEAPTVLGARQQAVPRRHPRDDVAHAAPVVEAPVQQLQLGRAWLEGEEAEGGDERSAAVRRSRYHELSSVSDHAA
jgi:hypothetical protein